MLKGMLDIKSICESENIRIIEYDLDGIAGMAVKNDTGYTVLINRNLCPSKRESTIEHEIWHIILGHLDDRKELSEEQKENEVEKPAWWHILKSDGSHEWRYE